MMTEADDGTGVCVVISTYQRPAMLREAIIAILAQTAPADHVVVSNDGFDEDTRAVCREFSGSKRPVILVEGPHVGRPSIVRNRAAERDELRGSLYVAFCDDDDRWLPDKLARQRDVMERDGWDVLGTSMTLLDGRGESIGTFGGLGGRRHRVGLYELAVDNRFALSSVMLSTRLWLELGGFCQSAPTWEDYDLWIRAAVRGARMGNLEDALVLYRVHDGLTSRETDCSRRQAMAHLHLHIPLWAVRPWAVMAMRRLRAGVRLRSRLRAGFGSLRSPRAGQVTDRRAEGDGDPQSAPGAAPGFRSHGPRT